DWIVSAKGDGVFVKTFKEEKEQNVVLALDVSASLEIGKGNNKKIDIAKEICGVLAISAAKEGGDIGLMCFSSQKELYLKPNKGQKYAYQLIKKLFELKPTTLKTNINLGIKHLINTLKKQSVVILVSDFIDTDYERNLIALAQKHDLVVIHLSEARESLFPKLGIIPLFDKETKKTIWVNSFSKKFRLNMNQELTQRKKQLESLCTQYKANYLWIDTQEDYILKLVKLFRIRNYSK
ncbi:MAG: VWA domain-containing protein, partial [Cytophagales bacterium]